MTPAPCVLLLEDDPSVQRFVQQALEGLPLQLHCCASLAQARHILHTQPVQLLLADLHLPDGSALALCQELCTAATQPQSAPLIVVFSGGVDRALEQQLLQSGIWQVLHKPVALGELLHCVKQALDRQQPPAPTCADTTAIRSNPAHTLFGGNQALFAAYHRTCLQQFTHDLKQGDQAAQTGDGPTLRRLGHNLKSVLTFLGYSASAQLARTLETQASVGTTTTTLHTWQQLRAHLHQIQTQATPE